MRLIVTLGAVAGLTLLVLSCRTLKAGNESEVSATEVRNYEDELGMAPGAGYDSIAADTRGVCVVYDGMSTPGGSQEAVYSLQLIENHTQLTAALGISSEAAVKALTDGGGDNVSAKTRFGLGTTFGINQYSVFMMVHARIRNEASLLQNVRIAPEVKAELEANPENNFQRFRERCGDSFMLGASSGGEYIGIIEISTASQEVAADLKRKGENASLAVTGFIGLDAQIKNITSNKKTRIWTYQRGGSGEGEVGMVTSTEEMIARLKKLADSAKVGANPRPLSATLQDYFTLSLNLPAAVRNKVYAAKDVIQELADFHGKLLDLQSNIDFVTTTPTAFIGVDGAKLRAMDDARNEIARLMRLIGATGKKCGMDYLSCARPEGLVLPTVAMPARRPTLATLASERLKVTTKATYFDKDAYHEGWFNPPECYLSVEVGRNLPNNTGKTIMIRRTPTTYGEARCSNLTDTIDISVASLKDAFRNLGVAPEQGWIRVTLWEDDATYDDLIGKTDIWFKELLHSAQIRGINNDYVNMDVGFDLVQ